MLNPKRILCLALACLVGGLLMITPVMAGKKSVWKDFFKDPLIGADGKAMKPKLKGKLVGLYFSAHWCPPCKIFSPKLVAFRNKNADTFEVIFVSSDRELKAQLAYMKEVSMPWPAVKFGSGDRDAMHKRFGIRGIPSLIILGPDGQELTRTARMDVETAADTAIQKWTDMAIAKGSMKKKSDKDKKDSKDSKDESDDDDDDDTASSSDTASGEAKSAAKAKEPGDTGKTAK